MGVFSFLGEKGCLGGGIFFGAGTGAGEGCCKEAGEENGMVVFHIRVAALLL